MDLYIDIEIDIDIQRQDTDTDTKTDTEAVSWRNLYLIVLRKRSGQLLKTSLCKDPDENCFIGSPSLNSGLSRKQNEINF